MPGYTISPPVYVANQQGGKLSMAVDGGLALCVWESRDLAEDAGGDLGFAADDIEEIDADLIADLTEKGLRLPAFRGFAIFSDDGSVRAIKPTQSLRAAIAETN